MKAGSEVLLRQLPFDIASDVIGRSHRSIAVDDVSLFVDEELGEVPLDSVAQQPAFFALEKPVERISIVTVDFNLGEEREIDTVVGLAKGFDLVVDAWLLMS